jgi:hypothetical protein
MQACFYNVLGSFSLCTNEFANIEVTKVRYPGSLRLLQSRNVFINPNDFKIIGLGLMAYGA